VITPLSKQWQGDYFDGRTAERRSVTIRLLADGLEIVQPDRESVYWPYAEIRPVQRDSAEGCVRLERGEDPAETVVVRNEAFLAALRQSAPAEAGRFVRGQTQTRWDLTLLAIVAVVALGSLLYFWGVPAAGRVMARMLPVAWEERLAEAVIKAWAPEEEQCFDEEKMASLRAVLDRLLEAVPGSPYQYKLIVMRGPMNAFALPAGTIVVTDALLASTDSPEQLAGVLAHEIQHVEMGHSTQGLFREFAAQWLLSTLTGDASKGSMALETAALLADLSHSREDEAAADREGMNLTMAAGVDPKGMIEMFEKFKKLEESMPLGLGTHADYLSSHPSTGNRIALLQAMAGQAKEEVRPLLPGSDWGKIKAICGGTARRPPGSHP